MNLSCKQIDSAILRQVAIVKYKHTMTALNNTQFNSVACGRSIALSKGTSVFHNYFLFLAQTLNAVRSL